MQERSERPGSTPQNPVLRSSYGCVRFTKVSLPHGVVTVQLIAAPASRTSKKRKGYPLGARNNSRDAVLGFTLDVPG
ncbi:hypothetical protein SVAN01_09852 [Stagonosporopsis vannaccii]|nr:hypothetical protein SVAN01_09852 [Stagonosporopsis vannaccii]